MNKALLIISTLLLSSLMSIEFTSPLFAQNQTNMTSTQKNETGIGTASELENLTSDNSALLQNTSDIGSQNASVTGGLEQEQEATESSNMTSEQQQNQTNMTTATNETGAMMGNQTNQTEQVGNKTQQGPLEQLSEALSGIFGGGNESQ
jgi:hypothetical protein